MPATAVRQANTVTFHPDSYNNNSSSSSSSNTNENGSGPNSRGSSEEKQIDPKSRSKKVEDEISRLWDTGQVWTEKIFI
jgi:hypothetical protein